MISRLQILMQRHHKILFGSLLVVVVVAFVLTFGPTGGFGRTEKKFSKQEYFNYNLASQNDVQAIFFDAEISMWLSSGYHTNRSDMLETYAFIRTAGLAMADKYGIPAPNEKQFEKFLKDSQLFKESDGTFSAAKFTNFTDNVEASATVNQNDVARIVREDWRIQEVRKLIAGNGYLLPFETRKYLENSDTIWSVEIATLNYNDFNPEITPTEEELQAFYDENPARFENPEMIKTTLVAFDGDQYESLVEKPKEMELIKHFNENIERYRRLKKQQQASPQIPLLPDSVNPNVPEEPQFMEFRSQVESDLIAQRANRLAAENAVKMTYDIYRNQIQKNSPELTVLIEKFGAKTRSIAPYSRNRPAFNSGIMDYNVLSSVFNLNEERYWTEVSLTSTGAALLLFDTRIDPTIPPFIEAKSKVEEAYKVDEKKRLFMEKGDSIKTQLETDIATGTSFKEIAETLNLTVQSFDDFAGNNPPQEFNQTLFTHGRNMAVGSISPMVFVSNQGKFAYLKKKELPVLKDNDETILSKMKEQNELMLPATADTIMAEIAADERKRSELKREEKKDQI